GYWLLVVGYWLLVVGCWLLVVGYWLLVVGCWLLVITSVLDAHTLYVGCAMRTLPTTDSRQFFCLSPIVIGQLPTANCQQSTVNSQQSTDY
ncbi:hypothetical protein QUB64_05025, partial [Microcoleus sp. Aus8_D2]|uniref:hypothetical protein n=1 Tax=Microcoleus sp. Aus8_D2 TaxID=2818632 RepID=UPI002FD310F0